MNHSEERLTTALRNLAARSPRGASPELGLALKDAFHRHHSMRRIRRVRIAALAVFLTALAALPLVKKFSFTRPSRSVAVTIPPETTAPAPQASDSATRPPAVKTSASNRTKPHTTSGFVALPSFESVPADELRVVRLEMPVRALRLVGVPVSEDVPDRRVLADFVVGPDRTPYAVRLVSYSTRRGD